MKPSARLLRLLSLLPACSRWTGPELCDRLGISARTVRCDVAKLRDLDYRVHAEPRGAGGYSLQPGGTIPLVRNRWSSWSPAVPLKRVNEFAAGTWRPARLPLVSR